MRCGAVLAGVVTVVGLYGIVARPSLDDHRARLTQIMERERIAGAGIALVVGDEVVWAGGLGLADRERGIPVTADTLFRVGSITKSFVVLALMRLVEQGRLALDAPVA